MWLTPDHTRHTSTMTEVKAAAIRKQVEAKQQQARELAALISDIEAVKAARAEALENVTRANPADVETQVKLRGEIVGAEQLLTERRAELEAVKAEVQSTSKQLELETAIERIDAITKEVLAERLEREMEVRRVMEFLAEQLPKLITQPLNKESGPLKMELRSILLSQFGIHMDNEYDGIDGKRDGVYRQLEERGVDVATIKSLANNSDRHRYIRPVPLDRVNTTEGAGRFYSLAQQVYGGGVGVLFPVIVRMV